MKKRILSVLLAFFVFFSMFPAYSVYAIDTEKEVTIWYFNSASETMEEAGKVGLYRGGALYLSAELQDGISGKVQWQIKEGWNSWTDIQGATGEDLRVSYGMVQGLLENDTVQIRCGVSGDEAYYSDAVKVVVTDENQQTAADTYSLEEEESAPEPLAAPEGTPVETETSEMTTDSKKQNAPMLLSAVNAAAEDVSSGDVTIHTVTIEYVYADNSKFKGQRVALPYIAEVVSGSAMSEVVVSPNCVGYEPDSSSINLADLGAITKNEILTVKYSPAQVSYTVRHYQQNVDNDEYTWVDTTMATGYTEALTSDAAANTYTGFTDLSHFHETIAADSSTMIDIYYDRNYYLMSFNLDGGHGVENVYARYGANVSVSDPERAGYTFNGWSLDGGTKTSLPDTMPASNSSYTALWTAGGTSYTIAYWLENPNVDGEYDFVGSTTDTANSGTSIAGSDSAVNKGIFSNRDRQYYAYNSNKTDKNITVAGDGSTVVNVYYDRNEYTLKFYYARLDGRTYDIATNTNNSSNSGGTVDRAEWNGNFATKPVLDSKYTEQSEVVGGRTYYYFTITRKYGASLGDIWPNAPLSSAGDYNFISWGTHAGSGYYGANSNKNIKGVYSVLDSGLLIDPTITSEQGVNHWMVGYWNNAPTMYTYEIYYSLLAGETADRTYNNVGYKKTTSYIVGSTDGPSGQTALSFNGVTFVGKDYDSNVMVDGTVIRFFYQRNEHTITLDDNYGHKDTYTIPYGDTIRSYINPVPTPNYPAELPGSAYTFGGWYQSKEGIGALNTSITMPDESLIYYAKWNPVVYTVTINDGNGTVLSTQQVSYGAKATKPEEPTMENATFVGWYYKDADGKEQRFDFSNMKITQSMTIYAKWRSNVMKQVEIHYVVEDKDGKETQIADTESLMLRLGQTRTFEAKTGSSLYAEYRAGCFPETASHSITPTEEDIKNTEPITFTFVYKKYGKVPYQVEFYVLEEDGTERPAFQVVNGAAQFVDSEEYGKWGADKKADFAASNRSVSSADDSLTEGGQYIEQHWDNDKAVVTELYVPDNLAVSTWKLPDAYLPNALKIQEIIIPSETNPETNIKANTIKFIYTYMEPEPEPDPDPDNPVYQSRYLVQHYIQSSSDPNDYTMLHSYTDETGLSGETATASPINIPGYTYSYEVTNRYMKEYNQLDYRNGVTENTLAKNPNKMSGTITADDTLELNFYYTVNEYPYQVMYLEEGTNRILEHSKTSVNGKQLMGMYGVKVTENAIDIEGYRVVGPSEKSIYIQMEAGNQASVNTIVFYYSLKSADLIISKTVELDEEQAKEENIDALPSTALEQKFEFNVYCPTGYNKSVYNYTITTETKNADGTVTKTSSTDKVSTADGYNMTVKLKHGQTIQIHDLIMGTYIITETYVPGFRITVDGGSEAQQMESVSVTAELVEADQPVQVDFLNSYPFFTGELVLGKTVKKADSENDPTATEPYKVKVTLTPANEAREVDRVITWTDAAGEEQTYTVPAFKNGGKNETEFTFDVLVPVDGTITLNGVPAGEFVAEETVKGTVGYIADYYAITTYSKLHNNEATTTASGAVVNGAIHGGHATTVNFTNTYKKGNLTINKTVTQEYANDTWERDTFTFTITGITELPDGTYHVTENGTAATVIVENGIVKPFTGTIDVSKTDGEDAWSNSLLYKNLPAGYYTVTEAEDDRYTASYVCNPSTGLVNDTTHPAEFDFTNIYKRTTGNLQVSKVIEIVGNGYSADENQPFEFTVELTDGTLAGPYHCVVKAANETKTLDDDEIVPDSETLLSVNDEGKLTFTLKHNQYVLIEELPVGQYEVSEKQITGYASYYNNATSAAETADVTIVTDETTELNCKNKYPVNFGTLVVSKTVVTPEDHSAIDIAPSDDKFEFTVEVSDYSSLIDLREFVQAKFSSTVGNPAISVEGNKITFTLMHDQWVELTLPVCKYTVEETGLDSTAISDDFADLEDHYTTTYVADRNANYAMVSGERETIAVTNTYKRHYLDLTITTDCDYEDQNFLFNVSADGTAKGDIDLTVVLVGEDSQTIKNLPIGDYTVTEQTKWSWREADVRSKIPQPIALRTESVTVPFDYEAPERVFWLSGYSYKLQKKGGN